MRGKIQENLSLYLIIRKVMRTWGEQIRDNSPLYLIHRKAVKYEGNKYKKICRYT